MLSCFSDGTRAYYFSKEKLIELFGGFDVEHCDFVEKTVTNVKEEKEMHRKWIQGIFINK